jgi:glycosyltransferase involved in cell wall biosynthesis
MSIPLVSVVIPFLNPVETFLREAVESVLSQDYRPLELICVDDGSNEDFSNRITDWCSAENVAVQVLHHEGQINRGPSASRNLGIAASVGKYVAFLDADDVWLPGKIRTQCEILEGDQTLAMVFGATKHWFNWQTPGGSETRDFYPRTGFRKITVFEPPLFLSGMLRGVYIAPGPSNILVRRDSIEACGGFEDDVRSVYEDQVFIAKIALVNRVCGVPICWDLYRQHANSAMAQSIRNNEESIVRQEFLVWLSDYCRERGLWRRELAEAIVKELWLSKASSSGTWGRSYRLRRWFKKWLLRFEERILPARIRRKFWLRSG